MKRIIAGLLPLLLLLLITACATVPEDRYNTQKGAAIGAGIGALLGQAIGRDAEGTLLGGPGRGCFKQTGHLRRPRRPGCRGHPRAGFAGDQLPQDHEKAVGQRQLISETVEEICEGEKRSRDY
jgi:hypothetical protein